MTTPTTEADQSPAHTLHVVGAYDGGVNFRLDCDDPAVCIARSHGDGCALQSWWGEYGGDLVDRDGLVGPPPWRVFPRWDGDEPTVAQIGWVKCEGSKAAPVGMRSERWESECQVCGRTVPSFSTLVRHNRPISVDGDAPTPVQESVRRSAENVAGMDARTLGLARAAQIKKDSER